MQVLASISYTKRREIGAGQGMNSKVYLADEPQLGGEVAVKEIEKTSFGNPTAYFDEAKMMFRAAHDNVVPVQYACETPAAVSLVMPFYGRGSLTNRIVDRPLPLSEVLRVTQGVLAGIAQIHLKGYVHFDVKPSNILFSDGDRPMVADFGQSRSISHTGVVTAPPLYRQGFPPETLSTHIGTILADIYQVGVLTYRALNGDPFFKSQAPSDPETLKARISAGKFPDRGHFMPHVPRRLRTIVRKALCVNPSERFQTATEMADSLCRIRLKLDWLTEPLLGGGMRWRASRPGHADLVVELVNRGGTWGVQTFTESSPEPKRARGRNANWRDGLSPADADAHLKSVFERLQE